MSQPPRPIAPRETPTDSPAAESHGSHDRFAHLRDMAEGIWRAAVQAVQPAALMSRSVVASELGVRVGPIEIARGGPGRMIVVGAGKAGAAMAAALEGTLQTHMGAVWCQSRLTGLVNVPAQTITTATETHAIGRHPARDTPANLPTPEGVAGTRAMLDLLDAAGPGDVAVCLISGGGSALMPAPVEGLTLADKQAVTTALAGCGASIAAINTVRKHLSAVKGGRLAQRFIEAGGRAMVSLILSDVVGDSLEVIASGPTAPDPTTYADALTILDRHGLTGRVPAAVVQRLREGAAGRWPETPKALAANIHNVIVGSAELALNAAGQAAREAGLTVTDLGAFVEGETQTVAEVVAGIVRGLAHRGGRHALIMGGETTVTLGANPGRGGRNQEFALAVGQALAGQTGEFPPGVCVLSGGTDGEDGPTDAAGAVVDATTWRQATARGADARAALATHNAYGYHQAAGGLLVSGPTGTNVMDVRIVIIERP